MTPTDPPTDDLDEILEKYFTGEQYDDVHGTFIRIPFTKQMDEAKTRLLKWREEAVLAAMNHLANELNSYDWQLEDSINANDTVCGQIDTSLAELKKQRGGLS